MKIRVKISELTDEAKQGICERYNNSCVKCPMCFYSAGSKRCRLRKVNQASVVELNVSSFTLKQR